MKIVRKAKFQDYLKIKDLAKELHQIHKINRPDIYLESDKPFEKDYYKNLIKSKYTKIFVLEEDFQIVAYTIIRISNSISMGVINERSIVYIDDFCVKKEYIRQGYGKFLFNYIKEYANKLNIKSIELNVWEFNYQAINFYKSLGMNTRSRRMEIILTNQE